MSPAGAGRGGAVGFLEIASIALGVEATDAMLKRAAVDLLLTTVIPRGKYLVMIGGDVASVESALAAGRTAAGKTVLDEFLIQNAHPQLAPAIRGRVKVAAVRAVGLIETREVASAIFAADAAVKAAAVDLIEARNQPGGKGLVALTGSVASARAAVEAGAATVTRDGMLLAQVVIPSPHPELVRTLTA